MDDVSDKDEGADISRTGSGWPAHVLAILGRWKDEDFPDASELRRNYAENVPREEF